MTEYVATPNCTHCGRLTWREYGSDGPWMCPPGHGHGYLFFDNEGNELHD